MCEWDFSAFEAALGKKVSWGIVSGREYSGKAELARSLASIIKGKVISMKVIAEDLKKKLGTEEEPFEGEVPATKIEEAILEVVSNDRAANQSFTYIFDDWTHKSATDFINALHQELGLPSFSIHCTCEKKTVEERFKKANETEEIGEEAQAELDGQARQDVEAQKEIAGIFEGANLQHKLMSVTCESHETAVNQVRGKFSAKVIVVNHDKHLVVDTICSNLAIKYDMLYLSVYQLIKTHVQACTPLGKQLIASKKVKQLNKAAHPLEGFEDEFEEAEYSAAHFDQRLVVKMIQDTLAEKKTTQSYILLEGLYNSPKLENEADRLALRQMDELFMIEKNIGEVSAIISLHNQMESTNFVESTWEEFEEPIVEVKKVAKVIDEDGNEVDAPAAEAEPAADGDEPVKPKFNPADFKWTVTNKCARTLPQLYKDFKGLNCICEERASESYSETQSEASAKALDEFCTRVLAQEEGRYLYQQVIFKE